MIKVVLCIARRLGGDGEAEVSLGPEFLHPTPENEGMDEW